MFRVWGVKDLGFRGFRVEGLGGVGRGGGGVWGIGFSRLSCSWLVGNPKSPRTPKIGF